MTLERARLRGVAMECIGLMARTRWLVAIVGVDKGLWQAEVVVKV